jgi:hypothetical protein
LTVGTDIDEANYCFWKEHIMARTYVFIAVVLILVTAACGSDAEGMVAGGKPPASTQESSPRGELWYTEMPDKVKASIDRPESWVSEEGDYGTVFISPPDASPNIFQVRFGVTAWDSYKCNWDEMYKQGTSLETWTTCYIADKFGGIPVERKVNARGNIQIVQGQWPDGKTFLIAYVASKGIGDFNIVAEARFEGVPGTLDKYEKTINRMVESIQSPPTQ